MKNMKKIMLSLMTVAVVAGAAIWGTSAFFSDTETSTGNTFTAGAIDLTVSAHNWSANQDVNVAQGFKDFDATDWNEAAMFNFVDLKPGDMGGGYFDLNIVSNPAYACFASEITDTADNTVNEPEVDAGDDVASLEGELQNYLNIVYFEDKDADGMWTDGTDGPKSAPVLLNTVTTTGWLALKDSVIGLFDTELDSAAAKNLGYMWCFGTFSDDLTTCDGVGDQNIAQTDSVTGTLKFYAEQVRNNPEFTCESMNPVFVLTDASEQNALNTVSQEYPWYTYEINGLCTEFTLHNPNTWPAYFDFQIDGNPGTFYAGLSDILIEEGPLVGTYVGNLYSSTQVPAGGTVVSNRCGTSEIRVAIHFGAEQLSWLDWATFTAQ